MQRRPSSSSSSPEMQIVDPTSLHPRIPPGWSIVKRRRSPSSASYGRVDTYYVEPETGRRFPSLASVYRHLDGGPPLSLKPADKYFDGKRVYERVMFKETTDKQIVRTLGYASRDFSLPDGWVVETVPRKNSSYVDKYYIEPGTGTRFRSLVSVERYLKETVNDADDEEQLTNVTDEENCLQLVPFRDHSPVVMNRDETRLRNAVIGPNRPEKVKWVLTGPGGNMFRPYVNGSMVSGSVREQWSEAFVSLIEDRF